ncbi:MAG: 4Fe-4S dicluster domain-containing protein, partial [Ardenticatenia bacterium]|nr:4Fe-4S dicluster domain-containing protein [Ardenticatenia bacterium]
QYKEFARVAGGLNPRKRIAERIRHRFFHKFVEFPQNYDMYSCCGCGRCIEACIAGIDTKEILEDLASGS